MTQVLISSLGSCQSQWIRLPAINLIEGERDKWDHKFFCARSSLNQLQHLPCSHWSLETLIWVLHLKKMYFHTWIYLGRLPTILRRASWGVLSNKCGSCWKNVESVIQTQMLNQFQAECEQSTCCVGSSKLAQKVSLIAHILTDSHNPEEDSWILNHITWNKSPFEIWTNGGAHSQFYAIQI